MIEIDPSVPNARHGREVSADQFDRISQPLVYPVFALYRFQSNHHSHQSSRHQWRVQRRTHVRQKTIDPRKICTRRQLTDFARTFSRNCPSSCTLALPSRNREGSCIQTIHRQRETLLSETTSLQLGQLSNKLVLDGKLFDYRKVENCGCLIFTTGRIIRRREGWKEKIPTISSVLVGLYWIGAIP